MAILEGTWSTLDETMEGSLNNRERRRYPRIVINLPLVYQEMDGSCLRGATRCQCRRWRFSHRSYQRHPCGYGIKCHCPVLQRGLNRLTSKSVAKIVWKGPCWKGDWKGNKYWEGYQYGLEFIQMSDEDRWKLNYLLGDWFESE